MASKGYQRTIRGKTMKDALREFIVKPVTEYCHIISFRCIWDVDPDDLPKASMNILSKKQSIERKIKEMENVTFYFSCLCAMKSTFLRAELLKNNPDVSDDDYKDDDETFVIPGKSHFTDFFVFHFLQHFYF